MDTTLKVALVAVVVAWFFARVTVAADRAEKKAPLFDERREAYRLVGTAATAVWLLAWGVCLAALIRWALTP